MFFLSAFNKPDDSLFEIKTFFSKVNENFFKKTSKYSQRKYIKNIHGLKRSSDSDSDDTESKYARYSDYNPSKFSPQYINCDPNDNDNSKSVTNIQTVSSYKLSGADEYRLYFLDRTNDFTSSNPPYKFHGYIDITGRVMIDAVNNRSTFTQKPDDSLLESIDLNAILDPDLNDTNQTEDPIQFITFE